MNEIQAEKWRKDNKKTGGSIKPFVNHTIQQRIELCRRVLKESEGLITDTNYLYDDHEFGHEDFYSSVQVSKEQYEEYKVYFDKPYPYKKIDHILDTIREKSGGSVVYEEWIEDLYNKCQIFLWTEMTEIQKRDYLQLYKHDISDISNYRGMFLGKGKLSDIIRTVEMREKGEDPRPMEIVLHDHNENYKSIAWILLHELGHAHMDMYDTIDGLKIVRYMNYIHEGHNKHMNYWDTYLFNDAFHEERPEEVFCNLIANGWMDEILDRHWWRENMAPEQGYRKCRKCGEETMLALTRRYYECQNPKCDSKINLFRAGVTPAPILDWNEPVHLRPRPTSKEYRCSCCGGPASFNINIQMFRCKGYFHPGTDKERPCGHTWEWEGTERWYNKEGGEEWMEYRDNPIFELGFPGETARIDKEIR